jgi:hypothetical protein
MLGHWELGTVLSRLPSRAVTSIFRPVQQSASEAVRDRAWLGGFLGLASAQAPSCCLSGLQAANETRQAETYFVCKRTGGYSLHL